MTEGKYQIGDPVWSKMKGYCSWPSRIAAPNESTLKDNLSAKGKIAYLVYFFGSNNFAWMPEDTIKPYSENTETLKKGSKGIKFKQGLKEIEEYITNGGKATLADSTTGAAIRNNYDDQAASPNDGGDSPSNDASNLDGELPSIDEELAVIRNQKPASISPKKSKNSHDSHNDSPSITSPVPSSVQKDYSRTPFKSKSKTPRSDDSPATEATSPAKRAKIYDDDQYSSSTLSSSTVYPSHVSKPPQKSGARNIIFRGNLEPPALETPKINLNSVTAKSKTIRPSSTKFGFIGLGLMGQRLLKNLLNSGHDVTIWNRSNEKCKEFVEAGAHQALTPGDVLAEADIVFGCLSDSVATKEIMFGTFGLLCKMGPSKGYVEMSSIDPEFSKDVFEAIVSKGGQYLEAPTMLSGKKSAEEGELVIIAAGDRKLYDDCKSCFDAMAKKTLYLSSDVGMANKMNLIVAMFYGALVGGLSECITMVERCALRISDFKTILKLSPMNSPLFDMCMQKFEDKTTAAAEVPLEHLQRDLRMGINLAEDLDQSIPITAIVNETFRAAKRYSASHDATALFLQHY